MVDNTHDRQRTSTAGRSPVFIIGIKTSVLFLVGTPFTTLGTGFPFGITTRCFKAILDATRAWTEIITFLASLLTID